MPSVPLATVFVIYVTGESSRSQRAVANLRALCRAALGDDYEVVVVDVLKEPERAEQQRVIATPTVVRVNPPPSQRVIGDLSDMALAAASLGLTFRSPQAEMRLKRDQRG